ncbi:MAG TPA: glycosyltransferase family 2 protein [Pseudonocardiaceae bacterium]|nr:glycosyltransferase family 2 protein [Pseudonocardiaceae bacterium]
MEEATVDVVLPCLNEAAALPGVLAALPPGYRAIVVDNGSTDGSAEIALRSGAHVVREATPGYGAAVHAGLLAATSEIVGVLDADGSLDPAALPRMVRQVRSGSADLVIGRRVPTGRGAWPWHARAGNAALAAVLRHHGLPVRDIGPIRVARRAGLISLGVRDRRFGYPLELLLRAHDAGWRLVEVAVDYRPRTAGTTSKVSGSVRGTALAVRDMMGVLR